MSHTAFRVLASLAGLALVAGGCALATSGDVASQKKVPQHAGESPNDPSDDEYEGANELATTKKDDDTAKWRDIVASTPDGEITFKVREQNGVALAEGDISFPIPDDATPISAIHTGRRWPNAVVPYVIDVNLPSATRVMQAIAHWEATTRMKFVPRTVERDYVHFRSGGGCSSPIGQNGGRQFVNLNTGDTAASLQAIGINRTVSPQRVFYFFRGSYATAGDLDTADSVSSHFRYIPAPGKAATQIIEVAFATNGHLFTWYDDGTFSEGDQGELSAYANSKPYLLAPGKTPSDVVGIAMDGSDRVHAYYSDGTFSVGTPESFATIAGRKPFTVADGKTPADVSNVDFTADGKFVAFYNETQPGVDGGAPVIKGLWSSVGTAPNTLGGPADQALLKTTFMGHCGTGATIHEIGHTVGLYHEQTRHDRDQFIEIMWDNITPANKFNFAKHSRIVGVDHGAYDFGSIMHYGPTAFSKNGKETIVPRDRSQFDGGTYTEQRNALSPGDLAAITEMYGPRE